MSARRIAAGAVVLATVSATIVVGNSSYADSPDWRVVSTQVIPGGSVVRLRQAIDGVQVFGGELVQGKDGTGAVLSTLGKASTRHTGSFPADGTAARNAAKETAVTATKQNGTRVTGVKSFWYDASLTGEDATASAVPAYFVEVAGTTPEARQTVVVNANDNKVLKVLDGVTQQQRTATVKAATSGRGNRVVCDADHKVVRFDPEHFGEMFSCGAGSEFQFSPARSEGRRATGLAPVDRLYDHFGTAQDFYGKYTGIDLTDTLGVDYGDGKGKALRGTTRACYQGPTWNQPDDMVLQCPWEGAWWGVSQLAVGDAVGADALNAVGGAIDDGIINQTSGLYWGYAASIRFGLADVFGKFIGIKAHEWADSGSRRWVIGTGSLSGYFRDLRNPAASNLRSGPGADRVGGEHFVGPDDQPFSDSLIVGKTAYLITDGDTFNGQDVHGIGEDKAIALLWGVQNSLTETADFRDLGVALNTVCANNVKTGVAGTTASDCDQVAKAVTATQLLPGSGS
ncbi:M4 family metallopeptidase [Actinocrispum sp. NPDC049592]|uniref:M4 family metallopeptidase n=1 Tax=Actinocrispum sp. NPDC049592 TaxID=3154835 RepID=UPI0034433C5B